MVYDGRLFLQYTINLWMSPGTGENLACLSGVKTVTTAGRDLLEETDRANTKLHARCGDGTYIGPDL